MINQYHQLLKNTLFKKVEISKTIEEDFFNHWNHVSFQKNNYLNKTSKIEKYVYFVLEGVQKLYFLDQKGKEHILGFSFDNSLSGDPYSMLTQKPANFNVKCITNSSFLRIERDIFFKYIDKYPIFESWWRLFLEQVLIGRLDREIEIISCTAEERFEKLHQRSPRAIQLIPQKDLASYLSMTAETYSRLRAKFLS